MQLHLQVKVHLLCRFEQGQVHLFHAVYPWLFGPFGLILQIGIYW